MDGIYIRNIIFGIIDSLVSTVGLLAGVSIGGAPRATIILTGVVYAFVEAFSMAVGSFLSEQSTEEYEKKSELPERTALVGSFVMFLTFVFAAFIPIAPYYFIDNAMSAFWISISLSVVILFIVGAIVAKISHTNPWKHGIKMVILVTAAIAIGVLVGRFINVA